MKTNSKNSNELDLTINGVELICDSEYPMDLQPADRPIVNLKKKNGGGLTLKKQLLGDWIDSINGSNGVYFLDFDFTKLDNYNIHYLDHDNGKLMEMNMPPIVCNDKDPKMIFLDKLIFDLSLFNSSEPIVVYGKSSFEDALKQISEVYYEYANEVVSITDRLIDLEEVFAQKYFWDSKFSGNTIKAIYPVLYPSQASKILPVTNSLAMYKIYTAILSIYLQIGVPIDAMKMAA